MERLKPCPFCGGKAVWWDTGDKTYPYQIICNTCNCGTDEMWTKESAIEVWNNRKPIDEITEQLKKEIALCEAIYEETKDNEALVCKSALIYAIVIVKGGIK